MAPAIWWIRRDLRLFDNQALSAALTAGDTVAPLFILDPAFDASAFVGSKRLAFLYGGLRALDAALQARGSRLIVRHGRPQEVLAQVMQESGAEVICAEADVSPFAKRRDARISERLPVRFMDGLTARPVRAIRKDDGTPYTVYTPFSRRWKESGPLRQVELLSAPDHLPSSPGLASAAIPDLSPPPELAPFAPGEAEAEQRLADFTFGVDAPIYRYAAERDRPDLASTSGLSPYIRFGMVSARRLASAAYAAMETARDGDARRGAEVWLNELIWREFYVNILDAFPHVRTGSFRSEYDAIQWDNDPQWFATWCEGRTGYPIVDAAMRQLAATGWMHNRTRMVVASFLVKDLLIDWRWGEKWFMQHLVDGDPANNNGGWQWTAGVGTDAAPYFRIFNPVSQGQKFDPDGTFVRSWLPELRSVPARHIHAPWLMTRAEQHAASCRIGVDYPAPIVDHGAARDRVMAAYRAVSS
jgi:deoxyribodipyrimidine photo-lyase